MNIPRFRKESIFGRVIDIFKFNPLFIGGWADEEPIIYVKTPKLSLLGVHISNVIFQLQHKVSVDNYKVTIYEGGGTINCGIEMVLIPSKLFDTSKVIWNARQILLKEAKDAKSAEELYHLFSKDKDYSIRRLAEIQMIPIDLGKVIDSYKFVRGAFGVKRL